MCVERRDNQMDKVDRKRKVGDELGSNNKDEYEDDAEEKLGTESW
jgi:hypothetical protein